MKKLKKLLSLLLAAVLMLSVTGCADEGKSFTTDQVTVWIWDESQLEAWQAIADSWTEETHITVKITVKDKATYWQEVERGMLPDILWMDSQHLQTCVQGDMLLSKPLITSAKTQFPNKCTFAGSEGHHST